MRTGLLLALRSACHPAVHDCRVLACIVDVALQSDVQDV